MGYNSVADIIRLSSFV